MNQIFAIDQNFNVTNLPCLIMDNNTTLKTILGRNLVRYNFYHEHMHFDKLNHELLKHKQQLKLNMNMYKNKINNKTQLKMWGM